MMMEVALIIHPRPTAASSSPAANLTDHEEEVKGDSIN